jgi:hypothetical protein
MTPSGERVLALIEGTRSSTYSLQPCSFTFPTRKYQRVPALLNSFFDGIANSPLDSFLFIPKYLLYICSFDVITWLQNSNGFKPSHVDFHIMYDVFRLSKYLILLEPALGHESLHDGEGFVSCLLVTEIVAVLLNDHHMAPRSR